MYIILSRIVMRYGVRDVVSMLTLFMGHAVLIILLQAKILLLGSILIRNYFIIFYHLMVLIQVVVRGLIVLEQSGRIQQLKKCILYHRVILLILCYVTFL